MNSTARPQANAFTMKPDLKKFVKDANTSHTASRESSKTIAKRGKSDVFCINHGNPVHNIFATDKQKQDWKDKQALARRG